MCNGTWQEHVWYHFKSDNGLYVPLTALKSRKPAIDGDLADWGDLRNGGFALDQHLCGILPAEDPSGADAALVKLVRDEGSLYLAARIHDESLVASPEGAATFRGDCFSFYLDVRLFPEPLPMRGDHDWVVPDRWAFDRLAPPPGVFIFKVVPPARAGADAAWEITEEVPGAEIACRVVPGGYAVEMRMPIAGMLGWLDIDTFKGRVSEKMKKTIRSIPAGAYDGRINGQFGFDVAINDVDASSEGKAVQKPFYVWGNHSLDIEDHQKHPSYYGVADPGIAVAAGSVLPRLLNLPASYSVADPDTRGGAGGVFQSRAVFYSLGGVAQPNEYTSPRWLALFGRSGNKDRPSRYDEVLQVGFEWHKPLPGWYGKDSAREVYELFPDLMKTLIEGLDLDHEGIEGVRRAHENGDIPLALAEFARARPIVRVKARKHTHEDVEVGFKGAREGFLCYEPMHNYPEHFGLKRMGWTLSHLACGWKDARREYALKWLDIYLRSWLIERFNDYDGDSGDLSPILYQLTFDPVPDRGENGRASEALILLLHARVPAIVEALLAREIAPENITSERLNELMILLTFLSRFPDFKQADEWRERVSDEMGKLFDGGLIYPDGTHRQLSSEAHRRMLGTLHLRRERHLEAGAALPEGFDACIRRMWQPVFDAVRPDGRMPLDGETSPDLRWDQSMPHFQGTPLTGLTPVMEYITSNGKQGHAPAGPPSRFLPWAGQLISRSGWDRDAHWSFFDVGPSGTGRAREIHLDRLHLSVSAYGRDLLVDSGAGRKGSQFHNVILVDGADQTLSPRYAQSPIPRSCFRISKDFDYARGTVAGFNVKGTASHTRALVYVRGKFWVVIDRIETSQPRHLSATWQFHPKCIPERARDMGDGSTDIDAFRPDVGNDEDPLAEIGDLEGPVVIAGDLRVAPGRVVVGKGALRIKPLASASVTSWALDLRRDVYYGAGTGPRDPHMKEPTPNAMRAVYTTRIEGDATFGWILLPASGLPPEVDADMRVDGDIVEVRLRQTGQPPVTVTVPLSGPMLPAVKTH